MDGAEENSDLVAVKDPVNMEVAVNEGVCEGRGVRVAVGVYTTVCVSVYSSVLVDPVVPVALRVAVCVGSGVGV